MEKLLKEKRYIDTGEGLRKLLVLRPEKQSGKVPGILWIHGGGYMLGMAEMVYFSAGKTLAEKFGAVVLSADYRLAGEAPYPAALHDCYAALVYMRDHAEELGIDPEKLIVGGESAGGGLAASVCLYARDRKEVNVAFQLPLYPMLDADDTASSRDNHGRVWNTRRNHWGWQNYLKDLYGTENIPAYASAAKAQDLSGMPPCYTFVSEGEPFYAETLAYVQKLKEAGIPASADVYPGNVHAFDLLMPWTRQSREAKQRLCDVYASYFVYI
ncbi:MAG: alpha/beta hydrolase [Solobacterium sp.]|nr:alpha/beta hydrolase [Solobacterium sp.]